MSKRHRTSRRPVTSKASGRGRRSRPKRQTIWLWVGVVAAVVAATLFLLLGSTDSGPTEISAAQAYDEYLRGAFFLDVRTQEDWNSLRIPGSVVIPLDELQGRLGELPENQGIVVICGLGVRSKEGAMILHQAGISRVSCLSGGLEAWEAAGYPLEQGPP